MSRTARHAVRLGALVGLLVGGWLLSRLPAIRNLTDLEHLVALRDQVRAAWWSPAAFVVAYATLAAIDFSGLVLTIGGGVVFGFELGVMLNTIGANLGASAAYGLARALGRDAVAALLGDRFARLRRVGKTGGFLWLLRLRLIPVMPFNLLNLGAGLTFAPTVARRLGRPSIDQ
jgi:uncharacterized membrane protein YdjX (TVP38/TMEM64 family)